MALKIFGKTDCVDKTLIIKDGNRQESFKISGIFKKVPAQSTLKFDFIIPFNKFLANNPWASDIGVAACQTWVLLKNNTENKLVESKIKGIIKSQESTLNQELFLFPLKDMALYTYVAGKREWRGMQDIFIAGAIGLAILLIACFNFINLSIAVNMRRFEEVGIKKVVGSTRLMIINQFIGETFIICFISLLSSLILIHLLLPVFNTQFNIPLIMNLLDAHVILFVGAILLFTILACGLLPALYLSSLNPSGMIKGKIITGNSYLRIRQGSIVVQFTIPIVMIIMMMIINYQDHYLRNFDIGIKKNKLIVVDNFNNIDKHAESIRSELYAIPGIDAVSFNNCIPARGARVTNEVSWEGKDASEKLHFWCIDADFDYNKAVRLNMVEGRYFNPAFGSDSASYIVNDVALGTMKNNMALGSTLTLEGKKGTIIGVIKDFHAIDLAGPIVPLIIRIAPQHNGYMMVGYSSGAFPSIKRKIESVFKHYIPESEVHINLVSDLHPINDLSFPSKLAGLAFFISLLLACAGLFGLASFTAESRTKEIGVRKANGASTLSIMRLLLFSYTKCIVIAFIVTLPVAFFLGNSFLARFHFHPSMPIFIFFVGPLIAAAIALLTLSAHIWYAASRNPVEALRYE
jgi:ABC-type antimicrobial peptide transport system permease subunit